jgi:hypothetical protein
MEIQEPIYEYINDFLTKSIFYGNNKIELKKIENANKLFEEG